MEGTLSRPHGSDQVGDALRLIQNGAPFVFITGKAGTGKSTFIAQLRKQLSHYAIVAPTGVAALNVGGQTIHSFFKFPPRPIELSSIRPLRNRVVYQALRTLIIDEISMVRADLLDCIDVFLQRNGPKPGVKFGGVQIIAVGDLFQLPPVVATAEEQALIQHTYGSPFFFSAKCLEGYAFKTVEFSKVFRQTDDAFVKILNQIREGGDLEMALRSLRQRVSAVPQDDQRRIVLCSTNATADLINYNKLSLLPGNTYRYTGAIFGEFRIDVNKLPAPMTLELKEGAQVMFLKNNKDKQWVNGTLGVVARCEEGAVVVEIQTNNLPTRVRVVREKWETFEYRYDFYTNTIVAHEIGRFEQIPLMPAWAVTIHKSQGKTFDRAHIDLGYGAFAEGQAYVALSRCRTLQGITLEREIDPSDVKVNRDVLDFYRRIGS